MGKVLMVKYLTWRPLPLSSNTDVELTPGIEMSEHVQLVQWNWSGIEKSLKSINVIIILAGGSSNFNTIINSTSVLLILTTPTTTLMYTNNYAWAYWIHPFTFPFFFLFLLEGIGVLLVEDMVVVVTFRGSELARGVRGRTARSRLLRLLSSLSGKSSLFFSWILWALLLSTGLHP